MLKWINVNESSEFFKSKDGVLFDRNGKHLLKCPEGKEGNYIIPDGTEVINDGGFSGCDQLTHVNMSDSVKYIGEQAFYGCGSLSNIILSNSLMSINTSAFEGCTSLKSITIPNSVNVIGSSAFKNCNSLINITLQEGINEIGDEAFNGCDSLMEVSIPDSVTSIGTHPFEGCSHLKMIHVGANNQAYITSEDGVLFNHEKDEIVQFPEGYEGNYTIPDQVKSIDEHTFSNCAGLKNIMIPASIKSIASKSFSGCISLENIIVDESNNMYQSVDGVLFNKDNTTLVEYPEGRSENYSIPSGTTSIGYKAFSGCNNLKYLTIPSGVSFIDDFAFSGCNGLTVISYEGLENPCSNDPVGVFDGCDSLHHICLHMYYKDPSAVFCGRTEFCMTESCVDLHFMNNTCLEETCQYGDIAIYEKPETSQWTWLSNACVEYKCDESRGNIFEVICGNEMNGICTNDGCLKRDQIKTITVEIDIEDDVKERDVSMVQIKADINDLTGQDIDVGIEINNDANVVRIVVFVSDRNTGELVANAVNQCSSRNRDSINDNCTGILRYVKSARVVEVEQKSSHLEQISSSNGPNIVIIFVCVVVSAVVVFAVAIVIIIALYRKRNIAKKNESVFNDNDTDLTVYILKDSAAMESNTQQTSDAFKSEPDETIVQAFQ